MIQGGISITLQCKSPREWNTEYYVMEGKVTDEKGKPLAGATIKLLGTKRGANSRPDGSFRIVKLQKGTYQIEVSYVGYLISKVEVVIDGAKRDVIGVRMKEKVHDVYEVGGVMFQEEKMVRKEDVGTIRRIKF